MPTSDPLCEEIWAPQEEQECVKEEIQRMGKTPPTLQKRNCSWTSYTWFCDPSWWSPSWCPTRLVYRRQSFSASYPASAQAASSSASQSYTTCAWCMSSTCPIPSASTASADFKSTCLSVCQRGTPPDKTEMCPSYLLSDWSRGAVRPQEAQQWSGWEKLKKIIYVFSWLL